jgi:anti-sigma-K factor RskA
VSAELHALAGAYALDALEAGEREVFEEHLAGCEECAAEVDSFTRTAAELSQITQAAPPPRLRTDVLAAISSVRPLAPLTDNVIPLRRSRLTRTAWQFTAAACALIAIVAAGWGYQQHRDASHPALANGSAIEKVLTAQDAAVVSGPVGSGHATIVYSRSDQQAVLIGNSLPTLAADKSYQLWLIGRNGAGQQVFTSAGTFAPSTDGTVRTLISGDLTGETQMGVSIEPAGGSAQPTDVIATMSI